MNDPDATTATAVALVSLGLAAAGIIWQLYYALRIDRARLNVTVREVDLVPDGIAVIAMTAVNVGRRATVLQSIHLTLGGRHPLRDRMPGKLRPSYDLMPLATTELPSYNSPLPKRLEPGDEVSHYARRELVAGALKSNPQHGCRLHARGFASTASTKASKPIKLKLKVPALASAAADQPRTPAPRPPGAGGASV